MTDPQEAFFTWLGESIARALRAIHSPDRTID
jgi:hypothetical protein